CGPRWQDGIRRRRYPYADQTLFLSLTKTCPFTSTVHVGPVGEIMPTSSVGPTNLEESVA
ncbi:hypothetical protein B296_00032963, partial [Ensete ventricosum]